MGLDAAIVLISVMNTPQILGTANFVGQQCMAQVVAIAQHSIIVMAAVKNADGAEAQCLVLAVATAQRNDMKGNSSTAN
jgi:hypothetical protein